MRIYYRIWIDAIKAAIKTDKNGDNPWQFTLIIAFSMAQGINLLTLFLYLKIIFKKHFDIFLNIKLFDIESLNKFISAFITLFLPFLILNYFLLFHKKKYKGLLDKYKGFKMKEGVAFMLYFTVSMLAFLLPIIIGKMIG